MSSMGARWVLALVIGALSGCAAWGDDDSYWFDAVEGGAAPISSIEFGYEDSFEEDGLEVEGELEAQDLEPEEFENESFTEPASLPARNLGPVCGLRMGTAIVRPTLEADEVKRTVRRHENDIRVCYNRSLRRDPSLRGRVTMHFVIETDGTVERVVASSEELADESLHGCLVRTVKRWRFPVPPTSMTTVVRYPYVFTVADRARHARTRAPYPQG